jgi:hypothetical protein
VIGLAGVLAGLVLVGLTDLARSYGVSQATISRPAAPSPFEPAAAVAQ